MEIRRALRHLFVPDWAAMRPFPASALTRLEAAVTAAERRHSGELRLALEGSLDPLDVLRGHSARDRARELFSALEVWDTEANSGVLIYLQMVDHRIEIVADRGIAARVPQAEWDGICRRMESRFARREFEQGVVEALEATGALLAQHFPACDANPDELPNRPIVVR